jgi:hypothetical protein
VSRELSAPSYALGGCPAEGGICHRELCCRRAVKSSRSDVQCFGPMIWAAQTSVAWKSGPLTPRSFFRLRVRQGPDRALVNRAVERLGLAASIPRAPADHAHRGKKKNRTFMQSLSAQRSGLVLPCRQSERLQRTLRPFGKGLLCVRVATRRRHVSVVDKTTSFSLKSSLPPSWWLPWRSSLPSSLSWPCRPL